MLVRVVFMLVRMLGVGVVVPRVSVVTVKVFFAVSVAGVVAVIAVLGMLRLVVVVSLVEVLGD